MADPLLAESNSAFSAFHCRWGYSALACSTTTCDGYKRRLNEDRAHKTTTFFRPNNNRSPKTAFDPEYTGSNIMGSAAVPMLGATALGSAGALAVPAVMKDGVFQRGAK